ncbi:hypothetical protein SAMN04487983_1001278 [Streptomyces sp. yr375]|nr:hypothetical protein SAMN04487983_1001278 [Streptomyces sp. yr375]
MRGAAVPAGVAARLVDADRRVRIRVEADGTRRDTDLPPDPDWPSTALTPGGAATLRLEHGGAAPSVVDAVILERAAGAARLVLDRTHGRAPLDDPALIETLLDATAAEPARLHAARRLGLAPAAPARARATPGGLPRVLPADARDAGPVGRAGVGPAVPVPEPHRSWAAARTALRFTTDGTAQDPGPGVVYAEELGGIALLADVVVPNRRGTSARSSRPPWTSPGCSRPCTPSPPRRVCGRRWPRRTSTTPRSRTGADASEPAAAAPRARDALTGPAVTAVLAGGVQPIG